MINNNLTRNSVLVTMNLCVAGALLLLVALAHPAAAQTSASGGPDAWFYILILLYGSIPACGLYWIWKKYGDRIKERCCPCCLKKDGSGESDSLTG